MIRFFCFISKFAKIYTPTVVYIALALAIIPPIIFHQQFKIWIYRALSFLVVSCPCALVISIPLSFFAGIGASSKIGVLIKGSNYLEKLSNTKYIVCDKTGTLTKGVFEVQKINSKDIKEEDLIKYAAYAEYYSNHPIALSLKEKYGKKIKTSNIKDIQEITGHGIKAIIEDKNKIVSLEKREKFAKEFLKNETFIEFDENAVKALFDEDRDYVLEYCRQ